MSGRLETQENSKNPKKSISERFYRDDVTDALEACYQLSMPVLRE
jgi:hypothetical protein